MSKRRRILLRSLASLTLGILLLEGLLRFLVLGRGEWAVRVGSWLRKEGYFASPANDDDAWKLRALFSKDQGTTPHRYWDEALGWTNAFIEPRTYRHVGESSLDDRRPILIYGDSFALCLTERRDAWEGWIERSEFSSRFAALNFGVGGYGTDQILLLLQATVDRFADRDPLVIVGLLIDDDLDRTTLALRNFPKPRFELSAGELVLQPVEVRTAAEFVASHPLEIRSYAWRFFLYGTRLVPDRLAWRLTGEAEIRDRKRALNERLLIELQRVLETRQLEYFFVLFHGPGALHEIGPYSWEEPFLYETFHELAIPFVSSKRALLEDAAATGGTFTDYFPPGGSHYDARGNAAVFRAFAAGIRREYEPYDYLRGAPEHPRSRRGAAPRGSK